MKTAVLDIGGSFIKYGQMDDVLAITGRGKVPTPMDGKEAFLQPLLICKLGEQFAKLYECYPYPLHQPPIVACRFRNDSNMIGAYYQFHRRISR